MGRCLVLALAMLSACDATLGKGPGDGSNDDDAGSNMGPDAGGMPDSGGSGGNDGNVTLGAWGTPAKVPGADSIASEDDATLSSTGLEMYFKRSDADSANLYVMTRATLTSAWSAPAAVAVLNSTVDEESPRLSNDDLTLYFGRGGDIYKSTRTAVGAAWSAATAVTTLNTAAYEKWGAVCSNGYAMVSRAVTNEGQNLFEGTLAAGANTPVAQLNSIAQEQGTFLSTDCLKVYFQSNRDNNQFDIYVATRATVTAQWSNPTALADFNTAAASEEDPWISPDQRTFVFATDSAGNKDVYISTR